MNHKKHWENVYQSNPAERVGWFRPHLETSMQWIKSLGLGRDSAILDVGGGASTLVDDLIREGYQSIAVVDLSSKALDLARKRLGESGKTIAWIDGDITSINLPENHYRLWHDRAVFHFLITREQRDLYKNNLLSSLKPGGNLILAVFAPEAPPLCSGLPVTRYTIGELKNLLGPEFKLQKHFKELHVTPGGVEQMYLYSHFRKSAES